MRIHVGCGSVYLDGWLNVDVRGEKTFLAADRPDLVKRLRTTDDKYYAKHQDKTQDALRTAPLDQEYVCDAFGDFGSIPVPSWQADEVLARHSFEHLSIGEARKALSEIDGVLKEGGILRLDVPDHEATLDRLIETRDRFYVRHLLGPRRNEFGFHMMSYTRDRLRALVEEFNFVFVAEEPNIHFYPAFCLRFVKPGPRAPREYAAPPYPIESSWNVIDVGPGQYPLERANVYADRSEKILGAIKAQRHQKLILANVGDGFPGIEDKSFDYVWCSHVLEHVDNPVKCAATLSRIGKRGTIVMPSTFKEMMFFGEELEHKWQVHRGAGGPIFVKNNPEFMSMLRDVEMQKIACHLYRTGPNRMGDNQRSSRKWFYKNEASLDVIVHWEGEIKIQVVE